MTTLPDGKTFRIRFHSSTLRMPSNVILVRDTTRALADLARWHRSRFDVPVISLANITDMSDGKIVVE